MTHSKPKPAGSFSTWLNTFCHSLLTEQEIYVPCGSCVACCQSSFFIHINTDETKTLSRIPKELLVSTPGSSDNTMLLGYLDNGYCPMFQNDGCSIYKDRPLTCRNFDCRIFAATGLAGIRKEPTLLQACSVQWSFEYPSQLDQDQHDAVKAAAGFLHSHCNDFPKDFIPLHEIPFALLAIKVFPVFLNNNQAPVSIKERVDRILQEYDNFEQRKNT